MSASAGHQLTFKFFSTWAHKIDMIMYTLILLLISSRSASANRQLIFPAGRKMLSIEPSLGFCSYSR
ncbi:hypothetical protein TTRE_0000331601 [Trichuris trichiura]|uniref:Uncharacterized protein n=1 Tax=Trichuris trichiura TaxID=36087 RepID=A0A077Z8N4_TRITR|nr:hypothetical protein TTRE_0000331601 [Trichuris trichiura]